MSITGLLVLPPDAALTPVSDLSSEVRRQMKAEDGDYALTRSRSRATAHIVDGPAAKLIDEFRQSTTVVQAVLRYCRTTGESPEATLEAAFPLLQVLVQRRFLVPPESEENRHSRSLLDVGMHFGAYEITQCLQSMADTDVYSVRMPDGEAAVLKLMRSAAAGDIAVAFDREASLLGRLSGLAPRLLESGTQAGRRYLLLSWCEGSDCSSVAARLRRSGDHAALFRLCAAILDVYAELHARGVLHADVHPGNILVAPDGRVTLIDFGLACLAAAPDPRQGGVAWFFEPEYAAALRTGEIPPLGSLSGEQYALAALLYSLLAGRHYLDFSLEKHEMLRQICEDPPLPLPPQGFLPSRRAEASLLKALLKDPAARFPSVAAFASEFRDATPPVMAQPSRLTRRNTIMGQFLTAFLAEAQLGGSLLQDGVAAAPRASVAWGSAGLACALHRMAGALQDPQLLSLADVWAERAARDARLPDAWHCDEIGITEEATGRETIYHGQSGVHYARALIASAMATYAAQQNALDRFIASVSLPADVPLDCMTGRSGILLAASVLLPYAMAAANIDSSRLLAFGHAAMATMWERIDAWPAISECHQLSRTGMAHGWAGLLYSTLSWCRAAAASLPANAGERLLQLAAVACNTGRYAAWTWDLRAPVQSPLCFSSGWCNGTAGQVHLWLAAGAALNENRFLALAERAGLHAAESDSRNATLCCGFTGQAYAQLALYRHTGERVWLERAQNLAERAAGVWSADRVSSNSESAASRPHSLYYGLTGLAVLAADLENPGESAMPAFESF